MSDPYMIGTTVRIEGTFRNAAGELADPTTVLFKFRDPNDVATTTYTYGVDGALVRDSLGVYHVDLPASLAGRWTYRFESTGDPATAEESTYVITASAL